MDFLEGRPGVKLGCYPNDSGQVSGPERCEVLQLLMQASAWHKNLTYMSTTFGDAFTVVFLRPHTDAAH
jgi:hypothetical protein